MFSDILIDSILNAWNTAPGSELPPRPERSSLKRLFEFVFLTSLKTEEGRGVRIRATLLSRTEARSPSYTMAPPDYIIEFEEAVPINPDNAAKIAGGLDYSTTSLAVEILDDETVLLWGLIFCPSASSGPLGERQGSYGFPRALLIESTNAGQLAICWGDRVMGRFMNGEFELALPDVLTSTALGQYFLEVVEHHSQYVSHGNHYWHSYRDCLHFVLHKARSLGHGATIIWCPDSDIESACELMDQGNSLRELPDLRPDLGKLIEVSHSKEPGADSWRPLMQSRIVDRLHLIAQLSVADGAVLITDGFVPRCYSAVLKAPDSPLSIVTGAMAHRNTKASFDLSKYGTRHKSAAKFIACSKQAIAFVISHDGPVRAFRRVGDETHIWKDCLSSLTNWGFFPR